MSLKHLLESIVQEADHRIATAKKAHIEHLQALEAAHEKRLDAMMKNAQARLAERKRSLHEKASSLGRITASKLLLETKNAEINAVYDNVLAELKALSKEDLSAFFKKCLDMVGDENGVIRATPDHEPLLKKIAGKNLQMGAPLTRASGGFVLSTEKREWDFTFDFLVSQALRPATEIDTAVKLFA